MAASSPEAKKRRDDRVKKREQRLKEADARAQLYLARERMNAHVPKKAVNQLHRHIHERLVLLKLQHPQLWPAKWHPSFNDLPAKARRCVACYTDEQRTVRDASPYQFDRLRTMVVLWLCDRCIEPWCPLPAVPR